MTPDDLKTELPNVVALLQALGLLIPDRVDASVVQYLERAASGGIECELLHAALSRVTTKPVAPRTLKFGS